MDVKFLIAGDRAVSVEFGSVISLEVNAKVRALDEKLKESPIEGMVETVPTYCALIVHYRPEVIRYSKLVEELGGEVVRIIFLMELAGLKGRERLKDYDVASVIRYDGK